MKVLVLSLLSAVALGVSFNTHGTCATYNNACTGSAGDPTTCLGQDALVTGALAAEGIDVTTISTWNAAAAMALSRRAHEWNWKYNGNFGVHIDLEPIYRCTIEANNLVWAASTACFDEWGSCITDPVCKVTWDTVVNTTKASDPTMAFTYVSSGVQAIGSIPFTPLQDHTTSPMTEYSALQIGTLVAVADMAGNGKIMAMMSCMLKDWVVNTDYPTGLDIQNAYQPCFDLLVSCSGSADCASASSQIKDCAADAKDPVTMSPHAMAPNVYTPAMTASHDDFCVVAGCASEQGNSLYMSLGTCVMDSLGYQFTKCYDDMVAHITMMFAVIGACSFVGGVLIFTAAWCMCCKDSGKGAAHGVEA